MDPLSALSIAASIVQFVDVGVRVLVDAREIYHNGQPKGSSSASANAVELGNVAYRINDQKFTTNLPKAETYKLEEAITRELDIVAKDMVNADARLKYLTEQTRKTSDALSEDEKALHDLTDRCSQTAQEFVSCLTKISNQGTGRRWKSFRGAVETVWKRDKIQEMSTRLDTFRSEIVLRILVLLNTKANLQALQQQETLSQLEDRGKEIIEVMTINKNMLRSGFEYQKYANEHSEATAKMHHAETIAAIMTLRDGTSRYIGSTNEVRHLNSNEQLQSMKLLDSRKSMMTLRAGDADHNEPLAQMSDFRLVERKVLDCLHFRQISDRVEVIAQHHSATFGWILEDDSHQQGHWTNFLQWLKSGHGCYWLNGKAGAGKSTLMKLIHKDPRYHHALEQWAGKKTLITASFFFWHLGSPLQKSQRGLLRSILYDIISQYPSLLPIIFPDLCRVVARTGDWEQFGEPTYAELTKAFQKLLTQKETVGLRICLLIDGLDEYDGDHAELAALFASAADSPDMKIVLSSRPIPACVDLFSPKPGLRLQDLSSQDIRRLVEDKLGAHPNMQKFIARQGEEAAQLITDIVEKASGVFLWVTLAVRSMLQGLQNFDSINDMQRRLEELPPDLEKFYEYMMQRTPIGYHQQASQMFQLVMLSNELQYGDALLGLQMSFAGEDEVPLTIVRPVKQITAAEISLRMEIVEGRVRSRCCGLLEVQEHRTNDEARPEYRVAFFHKTVVEFLRIPRIWEDILKITSKTGFDPAFSLLASSISLMKVWPLSQLIDIPDSIMWRSLRLAMKAAYRAQETTNLSYYEHLCQLDEIARRHWRTAAKVMCHGREQSLSSPWTLYDPFTVPTATPRGDLIQDDDLISVAVKEGLVLFVEESLKREGPQLIRTRGHHLLKMSISCFLSKTPEPPKLKYAQIISSLLGEGVDVNHLDDTSFSAWACMLEYAVETASSPPFLHDYDDHGNAELFVELLEVFAMSGADPDIHINIKGKYRRSALDAIKPLLMPIPRPRFSVIRTEVASRPPERVKALADSYDRIKELLDATSASKRRIRRPT